MVEQALQMERLKEGSLEGGREERGGRKERNRLATMFVHEK